MLGPSTRNLLRSLGWQFLSRRDRARTEHAARKRYIGVLQRALSCVSRAHWVSGPAGDGDFLLLVGGGPLELQRDAGQPLRFDPTQRFEVIRDRRFRGEYKIKTLAYVYRVDLQAADSEVLSWHWHPLTTANRPNPHIHITADDPGLGVALDKLHVPTGRVSFEEVVRFLIRDLQVQPLRDDHEDILEEAEGRFREFRTWA